MCSLKCSEVFLEEWRWWGGRGRSALLVAPFFFVSRCVVSVGAFRRGINPLFFAFLPRFVVRPVLLCPWSIPFSGTVARVRVFTGKVSPSFCCERGEPRLFWVSLTRLRITGYSRWYFLPRTSTDSCLLPFCVSTQSGTWRFPSRRKFSR